MKTLMVNSAPKGWHLSNDAVLITTIGQGRFFGERQFNLGRSLFRRHQDVLIFVKGDRKTAAKRLQPVTIPQLDGTTNNKDTTTEEE